jgi:hypothetical protein
MLPPWLAPAAGHAAAVAVGLVAAKRSAQVVAAALAGLHTMVRLCTGEVYSALLYLQAVRDVTVRSIRCSDSVSVCRQAGTSPCAYS